MTTPEEIDAKARSHIQGVMMSQIRSKAANLVMHALRHGFVLSIELKPTGELAMGAYSPEVVLRPVRGPHVVRNLSAWHADMMRAESGQAPDMWASEVVWPVAMEPEFSESEVEILVEVLQGQAENIRGTLAGLDRQRKREGLSLTSAGWPAWCAEDVMQNRIIVLANMIDRLKPGCAA